MARVRLELGERWEIAHRPIAPPLRPFVRSWTGYLERAAEPVQRREFPGPQVVVIFEFGPPLSVFESGSLTRSHRHRGGFVAGLDDSFSLTAHAGQQAGVQVNLTPLGAHALLGLPMHLLARRVVGLGDVWPEAGQLGEQLAELDWDGRLERVEALFLRRLTRIAAPSTLMTWAVDHLPALGVARLADELGYSRKHVVTLFHRHVGLSPKQYAGLLRFDGVMRALRTGAPPDWAALAAEHGFADQPHLAREVKRFTGLTPGALRREVTFLQDPDAGAEARSGP